LDYRNNRRRVPTGGHPYIWFFVMFVTNYLADYSSAYACPMCKEAISRMGEIWLAIGLNWSIYFMMAMPFILIGSFGTILYLNYRKHHNQ